MDKDALTVRVTIDTVYGFMNKYGCCHLTPINNKQVNQLCVENFKTNEEIQQCKTILMRVKQ